MDEETDPFSNIDDYIHDFLYGNDNLDDIIEETVDTSIIQENTEPDLDTLYITPEDKKIYEVGESIDVKKSRLKVINQWISPNNMWDSPVLLGVDSNLFYGAFIERVKVPKRNINKIMEGISSSKIITRKMINSLRIYKNVLLYRRGISFYVFFIEEHYKLLSDTFSHFGMDSHEKCILIDEILSTTDKMILSCGNLKITTNYLTCGYTPSEKLNFIHALDGYYSSLSIVPFDFSLFSRSVSSPEICLRSIVDIILSRISNGNYIYIKNFEEKNETDNWAFYYLDKFGEKNEGDKGGNFPHNDISVIESFPHRKKYWKLDCRMDRLITTCIDTIEKYTTSLFIKKYTQIYGDRVKREFIFEGQVRAVFEDISQLYTNIRLLSHKKTLCKELRKRFRINRYTPTINDFFDRQMDDPFIREEYGSYTLDEAMETENKKMRLIFQDS